MTCLDIATHFRKQGTWVDWERTTDTFKAGNPSVPVQRVAVAWKASWDALREAASARADLFISHESICVNAVNCHRDDWSENPVRRKWGSETHAYLLSIACSTSQVAP
jgi:hypothetical protein